MERILILPERRYENVVRDLGGSVHVSVDSETSEHVAVREINLEEMGTEMREDYETKMEILCDCNHMFIVPIHGYTMGENSLIVSKLIETSLRDILDNWNRTPWYDDTQRTTYALGIVKAMQYLTELGIRHGFLEPSNVMLEEDHVCPRLTKFGLSEFILDQEQPWQESGDYELTEKSDVYSFGMILSEMLSHRAVSGKAKAIQRLIEKCTNSDPENRPTFDEIWEMFATNEVAFPDADIAYVNEVITYIEHREKKRKLRKYKHLSVISETFEEEVDEIVQTLTPSDSIYFFKTIAPHFSVDTEKFAFEHLLRVCEELTRNPVFVSSFIESSLHKRLPFDRGDLLELTFPILWNIIYYDVNIVDDNLSSVLAYLLPVNEEKVLYIVGSYARRFNEIKDPWTLLDLILLQWKKVENEHQKFISIFHYLCRFYPLYRAERLDHCAKIIANFVVDSSPEATESALAFLCEFCPKNPPVSVANLVSLMENKNVGLVAMTLLLSMKKFTPSVAMMESALKLARSCENASLLLTRIADTSAGAALLLHHHEFMSMELPDVKSTFRIVLVMLRDENTRKEVPNCKHFPGLVSKMANSEKLSDVINILNFMTVCDLSDVLIDRLWKKGFFNVCIRQDVIDSDNILSLLLSVMAKMALKADVEVYPNIIDIVRTELPKRKSLAKSGISLFLAVSRFHNCVNKMKEIDMRELFAVLVNSNEKYQKHISLIERNIAAHAKPRSRSPTVSQKSSKSMKQPDTDDDDSYDDRSGNI